MINIELKFNIMMLVFIFRLPKKEFKFNFSLYVCMYCITKIECKFNFNARQSILDIIFYHNEFTPS